MVKYIARRLVQAIPTLLGITILTFIIMTAAPGGPTAALLLDQNLTPQDRERIADQLGVNDPMPIQYLRWLIGDDWELRVRDNSGEPKYGTRLGILRLDFGHSFVANRRVLDLFVERLGATLELGIAALLFGVLLGVPIGIISAVLRGSLFDNSMRVLAVIINAVPNFWLGLMLILLFGVIIKGPDNRGVLPMGSRCPTTLESCPPLTERLNHLLLPMIVLGGGGLAAYSRYLRASMLDVIGQDYIRTARAKGLKGRTVWFAHGARNALIPLATFLGPAIAGVWGGAFITEQIFSWPGIGRLTLQSINALDYPMVMAVTVFSAVATILGFILSDILYALIDPRIRFN
ncbi:MAG: ABC transporter permease [Chloroflexi bacterium CFX4]|nr:ABC transporter permease [Chloroflexi bacterium CFX4]MDL1923735.1 ABC transporter permease [Chloroflexi bacterium CFX3]